MEPPVELVPLDVEAMEARGLGKLDPVGAAADDVFRRGKGTDPTATGGEGSSLGDGAAGGGSGGGGGVEVCGGVERAIEEDDEACGIGVGVGCATGSSLTAASGKD